MIKNKKFCCKILLTRFIKFNKATRQFFKKNQRPIKYNPGYDFEVLLRKFYFL